MLGCCKVLVDKARDKIANGDVVLTYAMSSVVLKLLLAAKEDGKQFRVVVADARPLLEGREMMRRLLASGVSVSYCLTSGLAYIMREVTKVFVGAAAVLSNGMGGLEATHSHTTSQTLPNLRYCDKSCWECHGGHVRPCTPCASDGVCRVTQVSRAGTDGFHYQQRIG